MDTHLYPFLLIQTLIQTIYSLRLLKNLLNNETIKILFIFMVITIYP
jgi:hypothetical protein